MAKHRVLSPKRAENEEKFDFCLELSTDDGAGLRRAKLESQANLPYGSLTRMR